MDEKDRLQMIIDRALRFLRTADADLGECLVSECRDAEERRLVANMRGVIGHVRAILEGAEK